ncbi:MAG: 2-oxoacid:acceptor oxidoreductase subunit alpha [Candidatus Omnitrophota bacterium]
MNTEFSIKIAGEAGQGMQTIGLVLAKACRDAGFYIFANMDYMSRIRGGNNFFQLRISHKPIFTLRQNADIIIALDKASVDLYKYNLTQEGILIFDKDEFKIERSEGNFFHAPFYKIAKDINGTDLYINSVACGLIAGFIRLKFDYIENVLKNTFHKKSGDIIIENIRAARLGHDYAVENFKGNIFSLTCPGKRKEIILNGNEAIALGALSAQCQFYSAYPMTPSTSIMDTMAHYSEIFSIVVEQAEDEIAAVNMAIGASFAGVRAMTATSGGGFALMVEGLSLAAMTETPIVIVDAQRPAPATGFPTRTEQADLEFILHAGHGEFARAIYSPGTIEQCFYLAMKAFNLAEKFQIPVLILTDQHLADSYRNIPILDSRKIPIARHIISREDSINIAGYKRYQLTETGISPRAIPSWISDVIYVDSDEHNEAGHITEDAQMRIKMVNKRFHKKMNLLSEEVEPPYIENLDNASTVIIGFGSTYGVMKELAQMDKKIGFIHLSQVWPLPLKELNSLSFEGKHVLTVENNASAQLAKLLKRETKIKIDDSILRYDGRPIDIDYLIEQIKERSR